MNISVVIIAKNEAMHIEKCITSALQLTQDIIVVDTGSTDDTVLLSKKNNAKVLQIDWDGYGNARNKGAVGTVHNWIFSLDADEIISKELAAEILQTQEPSEDNIFQINRNVFWGVKQIKYGTWRGDHVVRIYNKHFTQWDQQAVHEKIETNRAKVIPLKNHINHFTVKSLAEFTAKQIQYAVLWAEEANRKKKKSSFLKQFFSPGFNFLQGYIFKLGFLDGMEGFWIAKTNAFYTYLKYAILLDMQKEKKF